MTNISKLWGFGPKKEEVVKKIMTPLDKYLKDLAMPENINSLMLHEAMVGMARHIVPLSVYAIQDETAILQLIDPPLTAANADFRKDALAFAAVEPQYNFAKANIFAAENESKHSLLSIPRSGWGGQPGPYSSDVNTGLIKKMKPSFNPVEIDDNYIAAWTMIQQRFPKFFAEDMRVCHECAGRILNMNCILLLAQIQQAFKAKASAGELDNLFAELAAVQNKIQLIARGTNNDN